MVKLLNKNASSPSFFQSLFGSEGKSLRTFRSKQSKKRRRSSESLISMSFVSLGEDNNRKGDGSSKGEVAMDQKLAKSSDTLLCNRFLQDSIADEAEVFLSAEQLKHSSDFNPEETDFDIHRVPLRPDYTCNIIFIERVNGHKLTFKETVCVFNGHGPAEFSRVSDVVKPRADQKVSIRSDLLSYKLYEMVVHPSSVGFLNLHDHKVRRQKNLATLHRVRNNVSLDETNYFISIFQSWFEPSEKPRTPEKVMELSAQRNLVVPAN